MRRSRSVSKIDAWFLDQLKQVMDIGCGDGRFVIEGVRNRDLQPDWPDPAPNDPEGKRTAGRITRWLRLLTAHGLLSKIPRTQCYRLTLKGQAVITCAIRVRNADLQKLAA